jgi:aspartyl-tRNA(Asn)/glutamyl-tRNA(Gln) amidotransferase subunit A
MNLENLTIHKTVNLIQKGEVSPLELVNQYLECIARLNPQLNAYITVTAELVLAQARQLEHSLARGEALGSLAGIPLALKDLIETQGVRTTAGSTFFRDYYPERDAVVVQKLYQAGAILLGKLNMHEIALGVTNVNPHYGACHNPWDLNRIPGGSSGGSAVAIATGLCMGSLGSDTGGSIRIPAALCGVVGLKPTYGRVSLTGVIPLSWSLDHVGPLACCVEDTALLFQAIVGYDPDDPVSQAEKWDGFQGEISKPLNGWRIAFAQDEYFSEVTEEIHGSMMSAAQTFANLGAIVEPVNFPEASLAAQTNSLITTADAAAFHRQRLLEHPEGFGVDVLQRLRGGAAFTATEYSLARHTQTLLRRQYEHFFENCDILLTPTTPVTAPMIEGPNAVEQARLLTRFTAPFNLTGLPALSLPCGFSESSLPIGLQLITRPWGETKLFQAGYVYEQATQWHLRKPIYKD